MQRTGGGGVPHDGSEDQGDTAGRADRVLGSVVTRNECRKKLVAAREVLGRSQQAFWSFSRLTQD